jgi:hypothetical protein
MNSSQQIQSQSPPPYAANQSNANLPEYSSQDLPSYEQDTREAPSLFPLTPVLVQRVKEVTTIPPHFDENDFPLQLTGIMTRGEYAQQIKIINGILADQFPVQKI